MGTFPVHRTRSYIVIALGLLAAFGAPIDGLASQAAPAASPSSLTLSPDRDRGRVVLTGRGVELFVSVRLERIGGRGTPRGVEASLGRASRGRRTLAFRSESSAVTGRYAVFLVGRDRRSVRLDFTLEIEAALPRLTTFALEPSEVAGGSPLVLYVGLDRAAGPDGAVVRLDAGGSRDVRVPPELRIAPGEVEAKVEIATAEVSSPSGVRIVGMIGDDRRSAEARLLPAVRWTPLTLAANPLRATGLRFTAVSVAAASLRATGLRFRPLLVSTEPLRATGLRFRPISLTTGTLRATGRRENR